MKPQKITFRLWAQLQTGAVSCVFHGPNTLRCEGPDFVMRGPSGEHRVAWHLTDDRRLNAHWQQFATL